MTKKTFYLITKEGDKVISRNIRRDYDSFRKLLNEIEEAYWGVTPGGERYEILIRISNVDGNDHRPVFEEFFRLMI